MRRMAWLKRQNKYDVFARLWEINAVEEYAKMDLFICISYIKLISNTKVKHGKECAFAVVSSVIAHIYILFVFIFGSFPFVGSHYIPFFFSSSLFFFN